MSERLSDRFESLPAGPSVGDAVVIDTALFVRMPKGHNYRLAYVLAVRGEAGESAELELFQLLRTGATHDRINLPLPPIAGNQQVAGSSISLQHGYVAPNAQPYIRHPAQSFGSLPAEVWPEIAAHRIWQLCVQKNPLVFPRDQHYIPPQIFRNTGPDRNREGFVFPLAPYLARRRGTHPALFSPEIGEEACAPAVTGLTPDHVRNITDFIARLYWEASQKNIRIPAHGAWPNSVLAGWSPPVSPGTGGPAEAPRP